MQKVATCCYCGATTALNLAGTVQHELACGACGAPLKKLKAVKLEKSKPAHVGVGAKKATSKLKSKPKKKKQKSGWGRMLKKAFDDVDDIFDIFD